MSQLDELLERSRSPAAYKNRRHFTLSREKAIEKQREFALRHPRQYVLELIQGAIFAGATYMAVDARKHDILIAWVGAPPLQRDQLENLFDYLFANRTDRRIRHLVQLAVGVNAILQRKPRAVRLESGADGRCLRLEMDADGKATIGEVENPIDGTYLVAEFDTGFLGRFGLGSSQWTQVGPLIEDKCLYTPVPILLNGSAPFGFRATRNIEIFGARDQVQFDEGERRGVVAVHSSSRAPRGFRVVVGGVWITTLMLEEVSPQSLVGVICDDGLRKTADHSDIVQDDRYLRMLHAVQPHTVTLLRRAVDDSYSPPALPPVAPEVEVDDEAVAGPQIAYAPVPDPVPMLGVRGSVPLAALLQPVDPEEPVFWCTPEVAPELAKEAADALRFPFRLLVLAEAEANTLLQDSPAALHRLNAPADIDFVLRVMERGVELRRLSVPLPGGGVVQLRLHRAGRLPAWGNGRPGVPLLLRSKGRAVGVGVVDGTRVHVSKLPSYDLSVSLRLPRVSLVIEADEPTLDDEIARRVLDEAWRVAAPEGDEVDRDLLAALLGAEAQPQFAEEPHPVGNQHHPDARVVLGAALPPTWPVRLRSVPLLDAHTGPMDLDGFLRAVDAGEQVWVRDQASLDRVAPLEERFGFGWVGIHGQPAAPLFAVARIGTRWRVVGSQALFERGAAFSHLLFVARHAGVPGQDEHFELAERLSPFLVAVRRRAAEPTELEEGWRLLYEHLRRLELENAWSDDLPPAEVPRASSIGRLALLQLADRLPGGTGHPILLPSDGGARWSLQRLRAEPNARVTAANGVVVAEPTTFCLTIQAYRQVLADGARVRLRYDDHPDVWRSLSATSGEGWLVRTEVSEARLRGWLGLRMPFDATCGVLFRTTGTLIALPELERRTPCHGLLWPTHGQHQLSEGERQLLQLAGLRMYAQLTELLDRDRDPDRLRAGRSYAWGFCYRAFARGRLTGTALALARKVEVFGEDGRTWGTLDRWLQTPERLRPPPPRDIDLPVATTAETADAQQVQGPQLGVLGERLQGALPRALEVRVQAASLGRSALADVTKLAGATVVLQVNADSELVQKAIAAPGPARELLLLEMARCLARWSEVLPRPFDLLQMQAVLLSQRFDA